MKQHSKRHHRGASGYAVRAIALTFVVLFAVACRTVPAEIPEGLTPAELFQRAQESVDNDNYAAAIAYYEAAYDRFSDNAEISTIALYELGFLQYRQGNLEAARPYFEDVLSRYENGEANLPAWPEVLATRLIERIDAGEAPQPDPPTGGDGGGASAPGGGPLPGDSP